MSNFFKSQKLKLVLIAFIYAIIIFYLSKNVWFSSSPLALGCVTDDTFDEMVLTRAVADNLKQGHFPLTSQAWEFPQNINLVITHKSYLHTLIGCFWQLFFSWPSWWNLSVTSAVWLSALGLAWAVLQLSSTPSQTNSRRKMLGWLLALGSGLPVLAAPFTKQMIGWGHIPQLLSLPAILALAALALIFTRPSRLYASSDSISSQCLHAQSEEEQTLKAPPRPQAAKLSASASPPPSPIPAAAYWLLALSVLAAAGVYWIWAALLTLVGLALLTTRAAFLDKMSLKRLAWCVVLTALAACPAALYVLHVDPDLHRYQQSAPLERAHEENRAFERMSQLTLSPPHSGQRIIVHHGAKLLTPLLTAIVLLFPCWLKVRKSPALLWFWLASVLALIGLGPYLTWNGALLLDAAGQPIRAPLAYLARCSGLFYYWRTPQTVWPLVLTCLVFGTTFLSQTVSENWLQTSPGGRAKVILSCTLALSLVAFFTMSGQNIRLFSTGPQISGAYYPAFPAKTPAWCAFLAAQPGQYATLDLPLGYCTNVWQTQFLHGCPSAHGKRPLSWLARNNAYIAKFLELNEICAPTTIRAAYPNEGSSEILYGREDLPRCFIGDATPSRFNKESASSTDQDLKAGNITNNMVKRDAELVFQGGLRYLVLHKANCAWLAPGHSQEVYKHFQNELSKRYGLPIYANSQAAIYKLEKSTLEQSYY